MKAGNDLPTRFLLGELSEAERRQVEERFLNDNQFFEQVLATEDALIDQYLCGNLTEEDHSRARFLFESSPAQRDTVEFTKQLKLLVESGDKDKLSGKTPGEQSDFSRPGEQIKPKPGFFNSSYVAQRMSAPLLIVIVFVPVLLVSWIVYLNYRERSLRDERSAAEARALQANATLESEIVRRTRLMEELESERRKRQQAEDLVTQLQSKAPKNFTTVTLKSAAFERSENSNLPTYRVSTPQIRIQLVLSSDRRFEKYGVSITTFGGREVWKDLSLNPNKVQQGRLTLTLPTKVLGFDDFRIELKGASPGVDFERVADYVFRLTR